MRLSLRRMCLVFFCQNEFCQANGYWLIIANNRDEYWQRPTKLADFWGEDNSCISGLDAMPERLGGTWFGANRNGRVGILLNIIGQMDASKEGRGFMVRDFLTETEDMHSYATRIHENKDRYNGFNLLLFDLSKREDDLGCPPMYVSNASNFNSCVNIRTLPTNTFFGMSNSPIEYPFQKVVQGSSKFGHIVSRFPLTTTKPYLIDALMALLQDRTPLLPDPVLEGAAYACGFDPERVKQHSAMNVHSPASQYGTRTSTVLLVDYEGNVDYVEKTACFEHSSVSPAFSLVHKNFSLNALHGIVGVY